MKDCRIFSAVFFFDTRSDAIHPSGFCSAELELGGFGVPFFGITLAPYKFGIGGSVNQNSLRSFLEIGSGLLRLTLLFIILVAAAGFLNPAYAAKSDFWCRAPGGASYEYNCGRVDFWSDMGYGSPETKSSCERRFKSVCGNPNPVRIGGNNRSPANSENTSARPKKSRKPVVEAPVADDGGGPEVVAAPAPVKTKKPVAVATTPLAEPVGPAAADADREGGAEDKDKKGPPAKPAKVAGEPEAGPAAPVAADVPAKAPVVVPPVAKLVVNPNEAPQAITVAKKECVTNANQLKDPKKKTLLNNLRSLMRVNFNPGSSYTLPLAGWRIEPCGAALVLGLGSCPKPRVENVKFGINTDGSFETQSPKGPLKIAQVCSTHRQITMSGDFEGTPFESVLDFQGDKYSSKTTVDYGGSSVVVADLKSVPNRAIIPHGGLSRVLTAPAVPTRTVASVEAGPVEEEAR